MTTIAYSNGILAADSRQTLIVDISDSDGFHCRDCGSIHDQVKDDHCKIYTGFKESFRGEPIIAIAESGNHLFSERAVRELRKGTNLETFYSTLHVMGLGNNIKHFTLIIVTESNVYKLSPRNKVIKFSKNDTVYSGSGMDYTRAAHEVFGLNIVDSIFSAMTLDKNTAGYVSWIDCTTKDAVIQKAPAKDKDNKMDFKTNPTKLPVKIQPTNNTRKKKTTPVTKAAA